MLRFRFLLVTLLALPIALTGCDSASSTSATLDAQTGPVPVILVSIDGFRPDYLHRGDTPTLDHLADAGVSAGMHPSFPSVTFPNHYTLVTGLRPDHNGIVGNTMHDASIAGEIFSVGHHTGLDDPRWWDGAEPIWVTAQTHGLLASTMFWPGSDVLIHGTRPADWAHYDSHVPPDTRVDQVLSWFERPAANRPVFATLYFECVDHAGHESGPQSSEVRHAARIVDTALGHLVAGLQDDHIRADIIIVSDHGMAATSRERVIRIDDLAPPADMQIVTTGAYAGIDPVPGHERTLAIALSRPHPHVQCWPKGQIPPRLAYGNNPRVPAFLCLADVGWTIVDKHVPHDIDGGTHGYDNAAPEMTATFIANGPAFQAGEHMPDFDNVDIYPLVMHLLGLMPLPSDGTIVPFAPFLRGAYANLQ